jgi:hypothetical protein
MDTKEDHSEHNRLAEQKIIDDVNNFGWHVGLFEATQTEASFGYTIGLWKTFRHPEIISFGLSTSTLHAILNNAAEKIKSGEKIIVDQPDFDIFSTVPAQFLTVDSENIPLYFGYCMWYNEYKDFPALQLVWTDREGKFPWQVSFAKEFVNRQPILNTVYEHQIASASS